MKIAVHPIFFKTALLLVFLLEGTWGLAQGKRISKEEKARQDQEIQALNKAILRDQEKQTELLSYLEENVDSLLQRDDTLSEYLANLDLLIDVRQKEHISYPVKLRDDCRDLIRNDLQELTLNGVRSGYPFKKITAINDAYLKDIFNAYKRQYRPTNTLRKNIPEFGRDDYLKAIRNIFTTIVTLRVNSIIDDVHVIVYSMREDKFVANSTGKTELILPLESGAYLVELTKPGYKRKVKKVILGKYPKTITINEALVMQ
jgi:hypothetical protein